MKTSVAKSAWNALWCLAAGLFVGCILKFFVVDILRIRGSSMEPALHDGQAVVLYKLAYGLAKPFGDTLMVQWAQPETGDVILYLHENQLVVKRCVAVGGASLEYSDDSEYTLLVGDQRFPLTAEQYHHMAQSHQVPENMVLAIGDNAPLSIDSRDYGFIPFQNILGKVICR
ncbi:MAG: signal peptidase I [Treponema sp.]|nr:signal peptidase I [Treponema sp.]